MFHNQPVFSTQLFGKCLDAYLNSQTNEFFLIDASDSEHIITKRVSHVEDVSLASDKNSIFESLETIKLDWESAMINGLSGGSEDDCTIRGYASALSRSGPHCTHSQHSTLTFKNVESFEKDQVVIHEKIYEAGIGFVAGLMISSAGAVAKIEKHGTELTNEDCKELPPYVNAQFPLRNTTVLITLPCENVLNRKYSVNALYYNSTIYQFDLESGKFNANNPISFSVESSDKTFSFASSGFGNRNCPIIPYLEGNRLRVFVHQNTRLYELVWNQDYTEIVLVKHLEWISEITSIVRLENFGLLVSTSSECFAYTPQAFNIQNSKGEGELRKLTIVGSTNYFYAPISKTIILKKNNIYEKVIAISEIEQVKSEKIKEIFNEEEYLENLKKDMEFNTYVPTLVTSAMDCLNVVGARITKAYQIKEDRYNDFEIIAGIRCKNHMDKLGEIISKDYIELEPEDFANYLGAPVMYLSAWSSVLEYKNHIRDMKDCRKSSKVIQVFCSGRGFSSSSSVDLNSIGFIGIVGCKEVTNPTTSTAINTVLTQNTRKEYEILFDDQEFMVESTSIIANDSLADGNPVIIENVRPGKWKWITTSKEKGHVDGGRIDQYLVAQLVAIHSDCYDEISNNTDLFKCSDDIYRELDGPATKTDYYPEPVLDGWYLMKLGVGVDAGVASFFDLKYYNNMDGFGLALKKKSLLETSCKLSYGNDWSDYLSKQMQQLNYPSKMAAPHGIITSSGYGDGCYACLFKKSEEGDVIAVRMIFA